MAKKCLRCGNEFTSPYPEVKNKAGNPEIACNEWCAACNKTAMSALFRTGSAYWEQGLRPSWQNEATDNVTPKQ